MSESPKMSHPQLLARILYLMEHIKSDIAPPGLTVAQARVEFLSLKRKVAASNAKKR